MINTQGKLFTWGSFIVVVLVSLVLMGCEETKTLTGLIVTPSASELPDEGDQVVLTASLPEEAMSVILHPLIWSVTDEANGIIVPSDGETAVYRSLKKNSGNIVIVRDKAGREGLATIN